MRPNCDFGEHVDLIFEAWDKFKASKDVKKLLKDPMKPFIACYIMNFKWIHRALCFKRA